MRVGNPCHLILLMISRRFITSSHSNRTDLYPVFFHKNSCFEVCKINRKTVAISIAFVFTLLPKKIIRSLKQLAHVKTEMST